MSDELRERKAESEQQPDFVRASVTEMYDLYRRRVEHEDQLINHRTSWFITLQAFLFTSVSLLATRLDSIEFAKFVSIFALIGGAICVTTLLSVLAAQWAISGAVDRWKTVVSDEIHSWELARLPAIAGSGAGKFSIARGKLSSFFMPVFVAAAWIMMLALVWTEPCDPNKFKPWMFGNTCLIEPSPASTSKVPPDFVPAVPPTF